MQKKKRKLDTIRSRFAFIISITVFGCMLLIQTTSFITMYSVATEHGRSILEVSNEALGLLMQDEYNSITQVSQIMSQSGAVGQTFSKYLSASTYMDQYLSFTEMEKLLTTIMFSSNSEFSIYYDTENDNNFLNGYQSLKDGFSTQNLKVTKNAGELTYHAIHLSQNKLSNVPVVSLSRKIQCAENKNVIIYSEKRTKVPSMVEEYCLENGKHYVFLQLNQDGEVCYCTDPSLQNDALTEKIRNFDGEFGRWNGFIWASTDMGFGTIGVLLMPTAEFYSEIYIQLRTLIITLIAAAILISVSVLLLHNLIVKKNIILQNEIERVGEGNLAKVSHYTGLRDYDQLLERFDWMIDQINGLLQSVEDTERRRGEVEREILYYQINPHFLLNTLNSAYWLAKMNSDSGIDQYIAQLTGILRYSLGKDSDPPTLRKEIEILGLYLKLQKQRHDFTYSLDVEEGTYLNLQAPRLFMQPVVENAIEHGMDVGDHMQIVIRKEQDCAVVKISDNGVGMSLEMQQTISSNMEKAGSRRGIGLRYVKTVLYELYGEAATIDIDSTPGEGTCVTISLPLQPQEKAENGISEECGGMTHD